MALCLDIEKKLEGFTLRVKLTAGNETLALLGASGCGKSMTLKCIAGILRPDRGRIEVDGVTLFDSEKGIDLPPQERRTGLMFQNYALFPNMTVAENIAAGARRQCRGDERKKLVEESMERFGLGELAARYPAQLSGGQQQRVALARILVSKPRILLLDEPFSALDSHLRFRLEQELRGVLESFDGTALLVSHDRDEVYRLAHSVAVMGSGTVDTFGEKRAVFAAPKTVNAALLTGCKNISSIEKLSDTRLRALNWGVELETEEIGGADHIGLRMHDIHPGAGENTLRCTVVREVENPFSYTVFLRPVGAEGAEAIGWELDKETWQRLRGAEQTVSIPKRAILLLKE